MRCKTDVLWDRLIYKRVSFPCLSEPPWGVVVYSRRLRPTPLVAVCYENRWRETGLSQVSAWDRAAISPLCHFMLFVCRSFSPKIIFSHRF